MRWEPHGRASSGRYWMPRAASGATDAARIQCRGYAVERRNARSPDLSHDREHIGGKAVGTRLMW